MRVIGYVRVSTLEQAESGLSIANQKERIVAWCAAVGHVLVDICTDAGVSSTVPPDEREGWRGAMKHLFDRRAEGVVFAALDRVARSVLDVLTLSERFNERGWSFISIRDSLDTKSAVGRFTMTLLAGVAQLEREMIGDRTRAAMAQLKVQRRRFSGLIPFGFKLVETPVEEANGEKRRDIVEEPVEQEIIRHAIAGVNSHLSNLQILKTLQETFGDHPRSKRPWTIGAVHTLMRAMRRQGMKTKPKKEWVME